MTMSTYSSRSAVTTAGKCPRIVCCTTANDNWQQLPVLLSEKPRQWYFCTDRPGGLLEKLVRRPNLALIRASWQAIQQVQRQRADLLVTSHPTATFWCAIFAALQNVRIDHIALSFYLPQLPHGMSYVLAQWAYSTVTKLIVHSKAERQFYSEYFGIPSARFEMQHWGNGLPSPQPIAPLQPGEYVCAISERPQDYQTLMAAIARLPHVRLIIVVPRGRTITTRLAANVVVMTGLSAANRMNLLRHSRFLLLPSRNAYDPCDHQTLVAAMRLGKAFIAPNTPNVSDYAFHNANALLYQPSNPESLAQAIDTLWQDVIKCEILGANGQEFVTAFCSDASTRHYFQQLLIRRGL